MWPFSRLSGILCASLKHVACSYTISPLDAGILHQSHRKKVHVNTGPDSTAHVRPPVRVRGGTTLEGVPLRTRTGAGRRRKCGRGRCSSGPVFACAISCVKFSFIGSKRLTKSISSCTASRNHSQTLCLRQSPSRLLHTQQVT